MAFPALELGTPGAPACPNEPKGVAGEEASLVCPGSDRLMVFIEKHGVFLQLGYMKPGARGVSLASVDWQPPKPMRPCAATLYRRFDAVRVYNLIAGEEAEVLLSVDST